MVAKTLATKIMVASLKLMVASLIRVADSLKASIAIVDGEPILTAENRDRR